MSRFYDVVIVLAMSCLTACGGKAPAEISQAPGATAGMMGARAGIVAAAGHFGATAAGAGVAGTALSRGLAGTAAATAPQLGGAGVSGSATGAGGVAAEAGSGGISGNTVAAGEAGVAGVAGSGGAPAVSRGTLPVSDDLEKPGPFTPVITDNTGPRNEYRLFHPKELGRDGIKHPIVLFGQGGGFSDNYLTLLGAIASHGFLVLCYWNTPQAKELLEGLDWLIAQHAAASGMLSGKLDTAHVAGAGHSYGALGIFNIAMDPRFTTTIHLQGGTLDPHMEVANLRAPAMFLCGETPKSSDDGIWTGDMANPNCLIDFQRATTPVFYGSLMGAAHVQLTESVEKADDPLRLEMIGAIIGWLRWKLADDQAMKVRYVGADCELCKTGSGWAVMQKGLM